MPLVSVVVSAYERPALLRAALDSLSRQTHSELEILVQDDSPSDACRMVVAEVNDPRIRYVHNQPSLGTVANLRAGYRKASGKYVSTLNDDDLYEPEYLETMVAGLEGHPECCLAFADHWIIGDSGMIDAGATESNTALYGRDRLTAGVIRDPLELAIVKKSIPGMFAMYRRALMDWDDFPDDVSSGYDFWITYLAIRSGLPVFYSPQRLTKYRVHAESQTSSFQDPTSRLRSLNYDLFMNTRLYNDARLAAVRPDLAERMAGLHISIGNVSLRFGDRGRAREAFLRSLALRPGNRARIGLSLTLLPSALSQLMMRAHSGL